MALNNDPLVMLKGRWAGWSCCDSYLYDPDGNRYFPSDIIETHWGRQMYREHVGYDRTILSLKYQLHKKITLYDQMILDIQQYTDLIDQARKCFSSSRAS